MISRISQHSDFKLFMKYLIPSMVSMILISCYAFVDGFVVGQKIGKDALAALVLTWPPLAFAFAYGVMFGVGGGSIYSIYIGKGDKDFANKIFSTSVAVTLLSGLAFTVLGLVFINEISIFLGADDKTLDYAREYLTPVFISFPLIQLNMVMSIFVKNDSHPNFAMVTTVIGAGLNVILDFVFVYFCDLGIYGAGLATAVCQSLAFFINFAFAIIKRLNITLRISNIDFKQTWRIMKNGFAAFVMEFSSGIITFVFIYFATKYYSTLGASIYAIICNWAVIANALVMGITNASQPLISLSFGQKNYHRMIHFIKLSYYMSMMLGLGFMVLGYLFTNEMVLVFESQSQDLLTETNWAMSLYMPAVFFIAFPVSVSTYFQSIENAKYSSTISMLHGIILPIAMLVALSLIFTKTGLWLAIPVAELIISVVSIALLRRDIKKWLRKV